MTSRLRSRLPSRPTSLGIAASRVRWAVIVASLIVAPAQADTLMLDTGERLSGRVLSEEGGTVVFESDGLGRVSVSRERIARIERSVQKEALPDPAVVAENVKGPAEVDRTFSELPQDRAAAPSQPPPEQREDLLRLWIDQGLRYQIVQPVRIPVPFSDHAELLREDVRVTGRIGVRFSGDVAGYESSRGMPSIPGDRALRFLVFYTTGDWSPTTSYTLQLGVVDDKPFLNQASLRWRDVRYAGNLSFGYLVVQQTLGNVQPFGGATFMEHGLPVLAFAPGNRMGLQSDRTLWNERGAVTLGLYSAGVDPGLNFGEKSQSLLRPTVRITGVPYESDRRSGGRRLLHVGASASLNIANDSTVRYQSRPESFIAPFVVDTGDIESRRAAFAGVELVWMQGPFTLQAEAMLNQVEGQSGSGSHLFGGAYVQASWMLTGEESGYNRAVGVPDRVIPIQDFSTSAGTWGAWQVAARQSYVDLTDGLVVGGRMEESSLGLNWWWNRYLRWQLNYSFARAHGGPMPGDLQILQGRVQLMY